MVTAEYFWYLFDIQIGARGLTSSFNANRLQQDQRPMHHVEAWPRDTLWHNFAPPQARGLPSALSPKIGDHRLDRALSRAGLRSATAVRSKPGAAGMVDRPHPDPLNVSVPPGAATDFGIR